MGVASYTPPSDGVEIRAKHIRDLWTAIAAQLNGNIDGNNIASSSVTFAKLAGSIPATKMDDSGNLEKFIDESIDDHVVSGLVWSISSGLIGTMTSGFIRYNGVRYSASAIASKTFTANKDTYVDIKTDGTPAYVEVANGATTGMNLTANSVRVAKVVTGGAGITSITAIGTDPLGNFIAPSPQFLVGRWDNPYKFHVYRATSIISLSAGTWTKVQFNAEEFDTNNNFDSTTNFRYTAPVTGYYQIGLQVGVGSAGISATAGAACAIYKNGTAIKYSVQDSGSGTANTATRPSISTLIQLTAGDYIEGYAVCTEGARDIAFGQTITFMSGFLVSQT